MEFVWTKMPFLNRVHYAERKIKWNISIYCILVNEYSCLSTSYRYLIEL